MFYTTGHLLQIRPQRVLTGHQHSLASRWRRSVSGAVAPCRGRRVIVIVFQVIERETRLAVGSTTVCGSTVGSGPAAAGIAIGGRASLLSLLLCSRVLLCWRGRSGQHSVDLLHACCDNCLQGTYRLWFCNTGQTGTTLSTAENRHSMPVTVLVLTTRADSIHLTHSDSRGDSLQGCRVRCRGNRQTCLPRERA